MQMTNWRRLADRVSVQPNGCWNWTGAVYKNYGTVGVGNRKTARVHRVVYTRLVGDTERSGDVHHLCENTICVNPSHLHYFDNSADHMAIHKVIICRNGHRLEGDNLTIVKRGIRNDERRCVQCHRERCLKSWHKRNSKDKTA